MPISPLLHSSKPLLELLPDWELTTSPRLLPESGSQERGEDRGRGKEGRELALTECQPLARSYTKCFQMPFLPPKSHHNSEAVTSSPWHQRGRSRGSERRSHCLRAAWLDNSRAGAQAGVCVICQLVFPPPHMAFNLGTTWPQFPHQGGWCSPPRPGPAGL